MRTNNPMHTNYIFISNTIVAVLKIINLLFVEFFLANLKYFFKAKVMVEV